MLSLSASEKSRIGDLSASVSTGLDSINDQGVLESDCCVGSLQTTKGSNDIDGIFVSVLRDQPSWRFRKEPNPDDKDYTEDDLESNGETPCQVIRSVGRAVVDPVRNHGPECNNSSFNTDEKTTVGSTTALSLIGWDRGSVDAIADTSYSSSDNQLNSCFRPFDGADLDDDTQDHDKSTKHHLEPSDDSQTPRT